MRNVFTKRIGMELNILIYIRENLTSKSKFLIINIIISNK